MKKDNNLVRKIYREKTINKIISKINYLGINCHYDAIDLLNKRLLAILFIFFLFIITSNKGYLYAPIITLLFYFSSEYFVLDYRIKKRIKKLDEEGLFFFEVLALTLETGRNLKGALDMTCETIDSEISSEFQKTLKEVKLGKSMTEALEDMKKRIPSDTICNVILNITQSSVFGNSIVESLYNQVDYLREKQLLEIKSDIQKMPVKISAISVVFYVPLMLLLILGPVLINLIASK